VAIYADFILAINNRSKDMLNPGGQNVYSKEVEDVVMLHPAVMEAAVIGVDHPEWGDVNATLKLGQMPGKK
jgi:feruloyl-CoA synthase